MPEARIDVYLFADKHYKLQMPPTDIWVLLVLVSSVASLCVTVLYWLSMAALGDLEVHTLLAGLTLGNTSDGGGIKLVLKVQFCET